MNEAAERLRQDYLDVWDDENPARPTQTLLDEALATERRQTAERIRKLLGTSDDFADALNTASGLRRRFLAILADVAEGDA